jgi:hypothetical protein
LFAKTIRKRCEIAMMQDIYAEIGSIPVGMLYKDRFAVKSRDVTV